MADAGDDILAMVRQLPKDPPPGYSEFFKSTLIAYPACSFLAASYAADFAAFLNVPAITPSASRALAQHFPALHALIRAQGWHMTGIPTAIIGWLRHVATRSLNPGQLQVCMLYMLLYAMYNCKVHCTVMYCKVRCTVLYCKVHCGIYITKHPWGTAHVCIVSLNQHVCTTMQDSFGVVEDPKVEDSHVCMPAFPLARTLPDFKIGKTSQQQDMRLCAKSSNSHSMLTPGLVTIFCAHGVCLGFKLMAASEGPVMIYNLLATRFKTGVTLHAAMLHATGNYCFSVSCI